MTDAPPLLKPAPMPCQNDAGQTCTVETCVCSPMPPHFAAWLKRTRK